MCNVAVSLFAREREGGWKIEVILFPMIQPSDVGCAVHICSLLHQKYAEFSTELLEQLQKIYSTGISKDEDKVGRERG